VTEWSTHWSTCPFAAVLGESVRVCLCVELAQKPRRSLNVSEEEGDRAGREIGSHAA